MKALDVNGQTIQFTRGAILLKHHDSSLTNKGIVAMQKMTSLPKTKKKSSLSHVAMYVGDGKMAEQTGHGLSYNAISDTSSVSNHKYVYSPVQRIREGFGPNEDDYTYDVWECTHFFLRKEAAEIACRFIRQGVMSGGSFGTYAKRKGFNAFFRTASRHGKKAPHMTQRQIGQGFATYADKQFVCSSFVVAVYQLAGQEVYATPFPRVRQSCLPGRLHAVLTGERYFAFRGKVTLKVTHY